MENVPFYRCISDMRTPLRLCVFHSGGYRGYDYMCKYHFANNSAGQSGSNINDGSVDNCKFEEIDKVVVDHLDLYLTVCLWMLINR